MSKHYRCYKSDKTKRKDAEITEVVAAGLLRRKIKRLQQLPDNFKEMEPGTNEWNDYFELMPARQAEMRSWASGPVLIFQDISDKERQILDHPVNGVSKLQYVLTEETKVTWRLLNELMHEASVSNVSFIYLKGDNAEKIVQTMNVLANTFKFSYRFKSTLKSVFNKEETLDIP